MRKAIPVEQRLALTLRFLATGADYRTIGHLFGMSKSTVCVLVEEVCWSIFDVLLPDYIHIRTGPALREVFSIVSQIAVVSCTVHVCIHSGADV